jgi:hypothetical protein
MYKSFDILSDQNAVSFPFSQELVVEAAAATLLLLYNNSHPIAPAVDPADAVLAAMAAVT